MPDIPGNASTTATFVGDPLTLAMVNGELEMYGDQDWIAITLLPGTTYSFFGSTQTYGPGGGDCKLTLYGPDGVTVIDTDDDDGPGLNSFVRYTTPATAAVYFISIEDVHGAAGDWSLGVTSLGTDPEEHDDSDETGTLGSPTVLEVWGRGRDKGTDFSYAMGEQGDDTMDAGNSGSALSGGIGNDSLTGGNGADRLFGDSGHDDINAGFGNDTIYGGDGADGLFGGAGDDQTFGGDGADYISDFAGINTILGEGGNDKIYAGSDNDFVRGGAGEDWMDGSTGVLDAADYSDKSSSVRVTLNGSAEVAVLVGGVAEDTISNFEMVVGGTAGDKLKGDGLANRFLGNAGKDALVGGDGNDTLKGGLGKDQLKGGAGFDAFTFDSKLGSSNVDTIFKFEHAVDRILLDGAVMPKLGPVMTADQFYKAAGATHGHDASDRIVYNTSTGALYYDKDGSGRHDAVKFAILDHHPTLTFSDFLIVA